MTIDWWTLALQTVNFLVLAWILGRFFFRPVRRIIVGRQEAAQRILTDAEAVRGEAMRTLAAARKARADIDGDRDRLLATAQADAGRERDRLLALAKAESDRLIDDAKATAEQQRAAMEQGLIDRARELAVEIAGRLLARQPPACALDTFLRPLCDETAKLKPGARAAFLDADKPTEVVTAAPLSQGDRDHVASELEAAFGAPLKLLFRTDAAVIAGIELNAPARAFIRSSWREDLEHIRNELSSDRPSSR
jgi:F-type H+-transporting ATPase subunit b